MTVALAAMLGPAYVRAQEPTSALEQSREDTLQLGLDDVSLLGQDPQQTKTTTDGKSSLPDGSTPKINPADPNTRDDQQGKQPKRILWIIPNYRAVSANTYLPPLSFEGQTLAGDGGYVRLLRFHFRGRARGNFAGPKFAAVLRARWCRLRPILLAHLCRRSHRELHGGSDRASGDERRPEILHTGQRRILQADRVCGKPAVHHQDRRGKEYFQFFRDRGGWNSRGHRQCVLPATIQSLGENVSTLGNAGGLGRRVQRIKRVLAGYQSGGIPRKILIPFVLAPTTPRFIEKHASSN
jgi:hypothetical protein